MIGSLMYRSRFACSFLFILLRLGFFRYVASFYFLLIFDTIGDKIKIAKLKTKGGN